MGVNKSQATKTIAVLGTRGFPGVQGGVESHCQHLYPLMPQYRFRVYRRKPYLTEQSTGEYENINFVDWRTTRIQGFEAAWHTLRATLHCMIHRPDLIHVHNMGPALLALPLRLLGIPIVMTYHSVNYEHLKWGKLARWLLRQSERLSLRYCDRIIFVNRLRMSLFDDYLLDRCVYIPNGVDPVQPTTMTDFLEAKGLRSRDYLLAVGRISPEKGLEHLVRVANQSEHIKQVVIAGESSHKDGYLQHLKALDINHKVVFTGYVTGDQLNQLYSHAQLFVLPSLSEGMPLSLLEAMTHRLPIVASDIDATRQMSLPSECYCKPGDAHDLQRVIERQLDFGFAPVDYDLTDYDWPTIAQHTLEVFNEVLE